MNFTTEAQFKEWLKTAEIHQLARFVEKDWIGGVHPWAVPYVRAMKTMRKETDSYGTDSGKSILIYGVSNMGSYNTRKSRLNQTHGIPANKLVKAEIIRRSK